MGPEGLVPSMLGFGMVPTFPTGDNNMKRQAERMGVMKTVGSEMERITSESRIKASLNARLPPAKKYNFRPGQMVRVYIEASRKWEGPFKIRKIREKLIWITDCVKEMIFN